MAKNSKLTPKSVQRGTSTTPPNPSSSTEKVFDDLDALSLFLEIAYQIRDGKSLKAAIAHQKGVPSALETRFNRTRKRLEAYFGIRLFDSGAGKVLIPAQSREGLEVFDSLCGRIRSILDMRNELKSISPIPKSSPVAIGSIQSIFGIFFPALISVALQKMGENCPDIEMVPGNEQAMLRQLLERRIDFAILPTGFIRPNHNHLEEIKLQYCRSHQGVLFVCQCDGKPEPFPEINKVLNDKHGIKLTLIRALSESRLINMRYLAPGDNSFEYRVAELFHRQNQESVYSKGGMRITAPTYRHERLYVHHHLGIGFSHPPRIIEERTKFRDVDVCYGRDPGFERNQLAFVDSKLFQGIAKDFIDPSALTFSIFVLKRYERPQYQGGLSERSLRLLQIVIEICEGKHGDLGYLKFDGPTGNKKLVHDFIYDGQSFEPKMVSSKSNRSKKTVVS